MGRAGKQRQTVLVPVVAVIGIASLEGATGPSANAEEIYWTNGNAWTIDRADADGSNVEVVLSTSGRPFAIAIDRGGGKVYWTSMTDPKIQRANLDGTGAEVLVTSGLSAPSGIALDLIHGKMYWTDQTTAKIQRANLDGTEVEDVIPTGLSAPFGIALDVPGGGKLYWTDFQAKKIQRANLDGTNVEDLVITPFRPSGIAVDRFNGKIYWGPVRIQRSNLDGANVEDVVTDGTVLEAVAITLDAGTDKLYWIRSAGGNIQIRRHNLDGSGGTVLLSEPGSSSGIALLLRPGDADRDGDVDLTDYEGFADCLAGPDTTPSPAQTTAEQCLHLFDFESDGDVDLPDHAAFQEAFTG